MDYEALAKQFGGTSAPPTTDYAALAKQFGGISEAAAPAAKQYASAVPQPGARNPTDEPLPQRASAPGIGDRIMGTLEAPLSVAMNAAGQAIAPYAGVVGELVGGVNTPEGRAKGRQWGAAVQKQMTYTPQTQTAQDILGYVGDKLEGVDLNAIPFAQGAAATVMAPAAAKQAVQAVKNEAALAGQAVRTGINAIPAVSKAAEDRTAANIKRSVENAGRIESAQLAPQYEIVLNPEHSNPSRSANLRAGLLGDTDVNAKMSAANEPKWTAQAKKAENLPEQARLDAKVFDEAHSAPDLAKPYDTARALPTVSADDKVLKQLDSLRMPELVSDTTGVAAKANGFLDELKGRLAAGANGKNLLDSARQLRQEAQAIYRTDKAGHPVTPTDRKLADIKMGAADAIESLIGDNLPLGERDAFNKARAGHARLYALEEATDLATGRVDPNVLGKMIQEGRLPQGSALYDLGFIAANHPEIAQLGAKSGWSMPRITRATATGALGGTLGGMIAGPAGILPGMAIGAGVGDIAKRVATNRMLKPGFQAANAIPTDYRPQMPVNNLRPVEPGSSNLTVFNPVNALAEPETRPNWVFGRPADPLADVRFTGAPMNQPLQISVEGTRGLPPGEWNAAAAPRVEPRAPTRGGQVFELDPISGKLTPVDRGIRGATPDTIQDFSSTLRSAVGKLSGKQNFAMTAAEKVAWGKTRVDLAEVLPGMNTLDPKQIAERMMDRAWVADAVQKARDKAAAFAEIEKRAKSAQTDRMARAEEALAAGRNRERMLDLADALEEGLRRPRAGTGIPKEQGPRTKAAIRKNNLAPENKNHLAR